MNRPIRGKSRTAGFTLLESMIALLVLIFLIAVAFRMINKTQANFRVESEKVDFTQQQREFIDQFTRDMHQAGYPTPFMQGQPAAPFTGIQPPFSNTTVTMQGDLDGTGTQTVTYDYNVVCSCMERAVGANPPVTAVENVLPPGPEEIFTAYDKNGNVTNTLANIRSIRITFTVRGGKQANGIDWIQNTMTGMARLPNNN